MFLEFAKTGVTDAVGVLRRARNMNDCSTFTRMRVRGTVGGLIYSSDQQGWGCSSVG